MSNSHELPFKTPRQLLVAIVAAFVIPIVIIVLLAKYVTTGDKPAAGSTAFTEEATAQRIKPVGQIEFVDASAPRALKSGAAVYDAACAACHTSGAGGAPKLGDTGGWAPRLGQGLDTLVKHAVEGFQGKAGLMPAKGGNSSLDDIEVARAVVHMANQAGGSFKEPEGKGAGAAEGNKAN